MDRIHRYESPLGRITLSGEGDALTGLWFDGQEHFAGTLSREHAEGFLPVFREAERWLDLYFTGQDPGFRPKLLLRGTLFRKAVWEILLTVPYGETVTYGQIADRLARQRQISRMSARAVGGAVSRNPISLIVPCHRVIGADGSLTGYAGGTERKRRLLEMEKGEALRPLPRA